MTNIIGFLKPGPLLIPKPKIIKMANGNWRSFIELAGHEVYFESSHQLSDGPEIFLSAFLLPAMAMKRDLISEAPVNHTWLQNIEKTRDLAKNWWGYSNGKVIAETKFEEKIKNAEKTALFFTAGIDAFHSLLTYHKKIDYLIFVEGFDIPLIDVSRRQQVVDMLSNLASDADVKLITVSSNLREHKTFQRISWWDSHGAGLAAIAHALNKHVSDVIVSGSVQLTPMGTHPDLMPGWNSDQISLTVYKAVMPRCDKVKQIYNNPLVQQYLLVCWQHKNDLLNCGKCEKCIRTLMEIEISEVGSSTHMLTFPKRTAIEHLQQLKSISFSIIGRWEDILDKTDSPEIRSYIKSLIVSAKKNRDYNFNKINFFLKNIYRELRARSSEFL